MNTFPTAEQSISDERMEQSISDERMEQEDSVYTLIQQATTVHTPIWLEDALRACTTSQLEDMTGFITYWTRRKKEHVYISAMLLHDLRNILDGASRSLPRSHGYAKFNSWAM